MNLRQWFERPIYAYIKGTNGKIIESGFIKGRTIDRKGREMVALSIKNEHRTPYCATSINFITPYRRLTHYRICYSRFQLRLAAFFGIRLRNKNCRLRKFYHQ